MSLPAYVSDIHRKFYVWNTSGVFVKLIAFSFLAIFFVTFLFSHLGDYFLFLSVPKPDNILFPMRPPTRPYVNQAKNCWQTNPPMFLRNIFYWNPDSAVPTNFLQNPSIIYFYSSSFERWMSNNWLENGFFLINANMPNWQIRLPISG